VTASYRERPVQFGPERSLMGILCTPPSVPPTADGSSSAHPVVIMLSAGVLHRVGASRIHVEMARRLAAAGFGSLRFDLSGIGDSQSRNGRVSLTEAVELDIDDAMAFLQQGNHGEHFVLVGLCSGAHDALRRAERDERVVGVFAIDLIGSFVNSRHKLQHYLRRLPDVTRWKGALARRIKVFASLGRQASHEKRSANPIWVGVRRRVPREDLESSLDRLLNRGARLAFYFTDGLEENYNYRGQFRDNYRTAAASPLCTSVFLPGSDHLLSQTSDREAVVGGLVRWMEGFRA
jgi:Serine aminopeptidase, S33